MPFSEFAEVRCRTSRGSFSEYQLACNEAGIGLVTRFLEAPLTHEQEEAERRRRKRANKEAKKKAKKTALTSNLKALWRRQISIGLFWSVTKAAEVFHSDEELVSRQAGNTWL